MPGPTARPRYHAWLLRCWEERGQGVPPASPWRFSLEDPHTGRRRGFADLPALVGFVEQALTGVPPAPVPEAGPEPDAEPSDERSRR
jgi:hypothetical protein